MMLDGVAVNWTAQSPSIIPEARSVPSFNGKKPGASLGRNCSVDGTQAAMKQTEKIDIHLWPFKVLVEGELAIAAARWPLALMLDRAHVTRRGRDKG
jgi:hypothetical protein